MSRTRHTENQFALDLGDDTPVNRAATESPEAVDNSQLLAHPDDTEALLGQWQQAGWIRPLDARDAVPCQTKNLCLSSL